MPPTTEKLTARPQMLMPAGLSTLETACGLVFGGDDTPPHPTHDATSRDPAGALTEALVPALLRAPCVVAFSGGRDSSLVLAAAVTAARRRGLHDPVPVTIRFPGAPDSHESEWQERVVRHLGLDEWVRIELSDGLDFIGAAARGVLLEHGPFYPANAHLLTPMLQHAAGGTIVTGLGGDELFGLWGRSRLADLAARRARPRVRDAARLVGVLAPPRARMAVLRRRELVPPVPWLRPDAQAELHSILAEQHAYASLRWDRHALGVPRARSLATARHHLARIAAPAGVAVGLPLIDPGFAAALARAGGWRGFGGRTATLRALFSSLLPDDVIARRTKATFNEAFFTHDTRAFAMDWSGRGLDERVVDPAALRQVWSSSPDYRSAMLLQSAWLHDARSARC
jgi:asparagine synthetase B (glutamine-hydrolysing)